MLGKSLRNFPLILITGFMQKFCSMSSGLQNAHYAVHSDAFFFSYLKSSDPYPIIQGSTENYASWHRKTFLEKNHFQLKRILKPAKDFFVRTRRLSSSLQLASRISLQRHTVNIIKVTYLLCINVIMTINRAVQKPSSGSAISHKAQHFP